MAVKYQDYYGILGLPRSAGQDEIRKVYRKLARKYHPDVNKGHDSEEKFKQIAEAYEVLGDPDSRRKYDSLGSNWRMGQEFSPPPPPEGQDGIHYEFSGSGAEQFAGDGAFSDFFEALFSGMGRHGSSFAHNGSAGRHAGRGADHEAELTISLEEAYHGANKAVSMQTSDIDDQGRIHRGVKDYNVNIPRGVTEGSRIRLAGQGGVGAGSAGDLYLRIHIAHHPTFSLHGRNLEVTLSISPWEAALGAKVTIPTLEGHATLAIPAGTQSGQRLRLREKGLPASGSSERGDLIAITRISIPANLSAQERELFQRLASTSRFNPRQ